MKPTLPGRATSKADVLARIQTGPQTIRDLAGGSRSRRAHAPIRVWLKTLLDEEAIRKVRLPLVPHYVTADWRFDTDKTWLAYHLLSQCVITEDGCHDWKGGVWNDKYPGFRCEGLWYNPRRLAWTAAGNRLHPDEYVVTQCDTPNCINPEHHKRMERGESQVGRKFSHAHRQAISRAQRANAKLTIEAVQEIRRSGQTATDKELAKRFGVTRSAIYMARTGKTWREPNPWAALLP